MVMVSCFSAELPTVVGSVGSNWGIGYWALAGATDPSDWMLNPP